ncbi:glycoside hydrolase family 25 protein [Paracoccus ravus]|uniref:glycoside hydrolase family 25 protein n=1 Tax=Paracoccus ravus TaxID=2447760 RepID=UPI00106E1EA6|nr:GH25 family lysozyme [Paracoccus ravus]
MKCSYVSVFFVCYGNAALTQTLEADPHGLSRAQLYEIFVVDAGLESDELKAAKRFFKFPNDADDDFIYGIDVSHHKGPIDWSKTLGQGVEFVYTKATEGQNFVDPRFRANIEGARAVGYPTGAYHFLSSGVVVGNQVNNFVKNYGSIRADGDLPPVLDLEWDFSSGVDRWANFTPRQIVDKAEAWLDAIEAEFSVKPIIYTNKFWWEARLGSEGERLTDHQIWMSRYGKWDQPGPPLMAGNFDWSIWQFTEEGAVAGVSGDVDVNKLALGFEAMTAINNPTPPPCELPAAPAAQHPLTAEELAQVFNVLRIEFGGRLDSGQAAFLNVMVNTSAPDAMRRLIEGDVRTRLSEDERTDLFATARGILTQGSLNQQQVDILDVLVDGASADAIRSCVLR